MKYIQLLTTSTPEAVVLGGKGSNLLKLVELGFNIPLGFIVNTKSYKKFLEGSEFNKELRELLTSVFQPKEIMELSSKISELFIKSKIPDDLKEEISLSYNKICKELDKKSSFAVRSSATIEDSSSFSFAGQADTFLYNKTLDDILTSIKKCWVSLFSPRALLYILQMKKKGINLLLSNIQMAVVIQQMVNSQISGVMFTANIINNDENQILINSTWGLGETIADNSVNPDMIIINKPKFEIEKITIGRKENKSIQNPNGSGTLMVKNTENNDICSLNESQLRKLYETGLKIEKAFNYPQDIEFAIEDDNIYILQTRPITTIRKN